MSNFKAMHHNNFGIRVKDPKKVITTFAESVPSHVEIAPSPFGREYDSINNHPTSTMNWGSVNPSPYSTPISGSRSIAFGQGATATGTYSTAFGSQNSFPTQDIIDRLEKLTEEKAQQSMKVINDEMLAKLNK